MRKTFREFYSGLEPQQRAQIVLGVVKDRHRQLGPSGDASKITFDAAEYLTDEATISAYLALVEMLKDPSISRFATADAERARRRIAEELTQSGQETIPREKRARWSDMAMLGRRYEFPQLGTGGHLRSATQQTTANSRPIADRDAPQAQRMDWALKRISRDSLT
jgi:hypothetical protein